MGTQMADEGGGLSWGDLLINIAHRSTWGLASTARRLADMLQVRATMQCT